MHDRIIIELQKQLRRLCLAPEFHNILGWSLLPPGKLFRSRLSLNLAQDLGETLSENHYLYASALEFHHTYSLVHDDLPSMDNDDFRRGKLSTHKKFGHWQGILAGDALLIASYDILGQINHSNLKGLLKVMGWMAGSKGLVLGQFFDLKDEVKSFSQVMRVHELKTGRLMQACLLGPLFLARKNPSFKEIKDLLLLGQEIGVSFQLWDDLLDLYEQEQSEHEMVINPFKNHYEAALKRLFSSQQKIHTLCQQNKFNNTYQQLKEFIEKSRETLLNHNEVEKTLYSFLTNDTYF